MLAPSAALHSADAKSDRPHPTARTARDIEGWKVRVDDRLLAAPNDTVGTRAVKFLDAKLVEIKAVVPAARVKELQTIAIVLDLNCGKLGAMQYHPDAGWLKSNGYSTELAKCVHLPRAADLPTRRNINEQPWVILHELAHGYHDQVLGFDEPRILAAYEEFKKSGRGDRVLLFDGRRVKHYALTDHKEFFAEMTESYVGVNDFFPFNRAKLKGAEPRLFDLLTQIWSSSEKRCLTRCRVRKYDGDEPRPIFQRQASDRGGECLQGSASSGPGFLPVGANPGANRRGRRRKVLPCFTCNCPSAASQAGRRGFESRLPLFLVLPEQAFLLPANDWPIRPKNFRRAG